MRLMFVHDHVFATGADGQVYSPGKLPYSAWERYLREFSELIVVARQSCRQDAGASSLSSGEGVSFFFDHGYGQPWHLMLPMVRRKVRLRLRSIIEGVDAVVVRLPSELGLQAYDICRSLGVPCAIEVVSCAFDSYRHHGSSLGPLYAPIAYLRMRHAVKSATHALYVTKHFLQARYPCHGFIAHASNVNLVAPDRTVLDRRIRQIHSPRSEVRVGMMGSLSSALKGLDTAIRALSMLSNARRRFVLSVAGDGEQRAWKRLALKCGVGSDVRFEGVLKSRTDVIRWLDELDLFIQPSKVEGLPRSVIEAMSRALPVIGSDVGGIPELLSKDCMFPSGNAKSLAQLMRSVDEDESLASAMAERNWRVATEYDRSIIEKRRHEFWSRFHGDALQVWHQRRHA